MTVAGTRYFELKLALRRCVLVLIVTLGMSYTVDGPVGGSAVAIAQETTGSVAEETADAKPTGATAKDSEAASAEIETTSETETTSQSQLESESVPKPPSTLRVATWSGAYAEAQSKAVFIPFGKETGIRIDGVTHQGGIALLDATGSGSSQWDVADVPFHVAQQACEQGRIQKINASDLRDVNGDPIDVSDFLDGAISPCAVGTSVWSSVIAFDGQRYEDNAPERLEDFFDVTRFPGKRGLPMRPRYVLEMALMADGVTPDKVYQTLASTEGTTRALAKLDTIKDHIVWWKSVREPATLLIDRKVAMAIGFNGRFYMETAARNAGIELLWDGQIYDLDVLVVPTRTQHLPTALKFISFAIRPETMAAQASWLPYGPARRSAAKLVDQHASLPLTLTNYLPTAPKNFGRALRTDEVWWDQHNARLIERFRNWIDGPKEVEEHQAAETTSAD